MLGIFIGMQQTDGDRADAAFLQTCRNLHGRLFIQRRHDGAIGSDTLARAETVGAGHQRVGVDYVEIIEIVATLVADAQQDYRPAFLGAAGLVVVSAALFLIVGVLYERRHTREIAEYGGINVANQYSIHYGISYPDAQQYLATGQAAIYPAGSWDIAFFEGQGLNIGFFGPPDVDNDGDCFISDHTDIALGLNAASAHPAEAKEFLDWVASDEFASLYSNALPGFYSLSNNPVTIADPVAQEAVDLRQTCGSTIRNSYQILSRGTPNLENELWAVSAAVINGTLSPEDGAKRLQDGLDSWYTPAG